MFVCYGSLSLVEREVDVRGEMHGDVDVDAEAAEAAETETARAENRPIKSVRNEKLERLRKFLWRARKIIFPLSSW